MASRQTFPWQECCSQLNLLAARYALVLAPDQRHYQVIDPAGELIAAFHPPVILPTYGRDPTSYLAAADRPGLHTVLLVQAGATAVGIWQDDQLLDHKVIKKYVVRSKGRAQPLHLKTRGKSRYGSRLRLLEARQQLVETNEKLIEYWRKHGQPRMTLYSVPVRTWPELFRCEPPPPFDRRAPELIKIPLHVHQPNLAELERVRARLGRAAVEWRDT